MLASLVLAASVVGCKKQSDSGYMTVMMTDAPGDYLHVNVDVQRVEVHYASGNAGWVALNTHAGVYDLLALQNNVTAVLAGNVQLPAGKITQLRLILGSNNTVMLKDSTVHPLTIPSSANTGIKIDVNGAVVPNNATVTVTLDYDADASINLGGNGVFTMNPVIKVKSIQ